MSSRSKETRRAMRESNSPLINHSMNQRIIRKEEQGQDKVRGGTNLPERLANVVKIGESGLLIDKELRRREQDNRVTLRLNGGKATPEEADYAFRRGLPVSLSTIRKVMFRESIT